ncbi:acyl carrier protein [Paraburkholderia sp. MMS20-SJTR3]|uniref:Acyl carrier protein n=1 Tax=Paraburkholderia sejongensis TaxID=2886946 RepID=A0ABS8K3U2_9BURK|nr:acyl carrier protein [Paraburkholderia sp. MMS20-SJTR3]MCC8396820.1 acyl carrier protein [Paraburkholderia sp. MMS20-SJTR3]
MKKELRQIIKDTARFEVPIDSIADDDDLYEAGLSSLNTIQLMLAIERQFNIEIPDQMLNRHLFQSVNSLADAVTALQCGVSSV